MMMSLMKFDGPPDVAGEVSADSLSIPTLLVFSVLKIYESLMFSLQKTISAVISRLIGPNKAGYFAILANAIDWKGLIVHDDINTWTK